MDTQDKDFMAKFLLVLGGLILFTVVVFLIARLLATVNSGAPDSEDTVQKARMELIQERLGKVGSVDTFDPNATKVARAGADIVTNTCNACHATGVLEAPKVGDTAAWQPRMAGGLDALMTAAINGKGGMPPRGGDVTLTDEEMKSAVDHMLKESGIDVAAAGGAADTKPAEAEAAEAKAEEAPAAEQVVEKAEAAVEQVTEKAAEVTEAAAEAVTETAEKVVDAGKAAAAGVVAAGTAAVAAVTTEASEASDAAAPAEEAAQPAADPAALEKGKMIYKTACFACHDTGVAGAPKLGDATMWQPRIDTGNEALYQSSLNGKGGMPPKGGRLDLNPDDIKLVVDYMVSEVK